MRRSHIVILVAFILVSILFYEPIRKKLFNDGLTEVKNTAADVVVISAINEYFTISPDRSFIRFACVDTNANSNKTLFYRDSVSELYTNFITVKTQEVIFKASEILPRTNKTIRFLVCNLSDSLLISCPTDTGMQTTFLSGKNRVNTIIFNSGKEQSNELKIIVHGKAKITLPLADFLRNKNENISNKSLLVFDLPAKMIENEAANVNKKQFTKYELIPFSYNHYLSLGGILNGENPTNFSTLPNDYQKLLTNISLNSKGWLNFYRNNGFTFFVGEKDQVSSKISKFNLFDQILLLKPEVINSDLVKNLTTKMMSSQTQSLYWYLPTIDEKTTRIDFSGLIKERLNSNLLVLSSQTETFKKTPVLIYQSDNFLKFSGKSILELADYLQFGKNNSEAEQKKILFVREDSAAYFFNNDSVIYSDLSQESAINQLFTNDGKKDQGLVNLTADQRKELFKPSLSFVKILTINKQNKYQMQVTSQSNFSCLVNGKLQAIDNKKLDIESILLDNGKVFLFYNQPNQLFQYKTQAEIKTCYGSIGLPVGDLNKFSDESILTAYQKNSQLTKEYDLIIENFLLLPLWRYTK